MSRGVKRKRPGHGDQNNNNINNHEVSDASGDHHPHRGRAESPVSRDLLKQLYATVQTLREHVLCRLPGSSRLRRKKITSIGSGTKCGEVESRLAHALDSILVCSLSHQTSCGDGDDNVYNQYLCFSQRGDESYVSLAESAAGASAVQAEIVDFVIWLLFHRQRASSERPKHLLCEGFSKGAGEDATDSGIYSICRRHPNSQVDLLKQSPWTHLLALLGKSGERIMVNLLVDCSVFVAVGAGLGNYYQLSGYPLSELELSKPASALAAVAQTRVKRPSDITFVRSRIFYAKPAITARGRVQIGFKHIHILNRCRYAQPLAAPAADSSASSERDGHMKLNAANAIKVMMYIFPRQFGLHNVFTSETNRKETAQKFQDYTLREGEITRLLRRDGRDPNSADPRVPKRLRGAPLALVQRLQVLHHRCTQVSLPATFNSFLDLASPVSHVSAFCQAVLSKIIPSGFWGQEDILCHNKTTFLRNVDRFIKLRRFESMTLHDIAQGLKVADLAWLRPPGQESRRLCQTDTRKRLEIFLEFLYYVFDSLLIPLIRSNFYVTESNTNRYQVFYFRHDVWRLIAEPAMAGIKRSMFEEMPQAEAQRLLKSRRLGFSQIRLLPKGKKLRPIMNLRRKQLSKASSKLLGPSINSVLGPVHTALKFEKACFVLQETHELRITDELRIRIHLNSAQRSSQQLYFAKVDVRAAFDTIPQAAVIKLLSTVPTVPQYTIVKHAEVRPGERTMTELKQSAIKPMKRWRATANSSQELQPFVNRLETDLARAKKHTVFVDTVFRRSWSTQSLLQLLTEHVEQNLVKVGKKFYRQKTGIPQGSVLSSFLCNYFYADLEAQHLGFLDTPDCLVMRLIDDFVVITLDKTKAVRFVETMHQGLPDFGVEVSKEKTLVNFDMSLSGDVVARIDEGIGFPYCGTRIDCQTLEITKDRDRDESGGIANSLTVEYGRSPGQNFQRKILNAFKIQSHLMFFDTAHNSTATVLQSLHGAFCETARKMWAYIRCLPRHQQPGAHLITRTITKVADVAFLILSSNTRRLRYPQYICEIRKGQVTAIAYVAFLEVLERKQAGYGEVLGWLRSQNTKDWLRASKELTSSH
ncbi:RING-finger domain containing protein [Purpureocillium lavendulum]|uniref:Telomerase reverse transcriptase n=1 Tax=Purpureocillium lavendulum TaxID=1247861 RepID=A0AB34G6N5_9HYPO|nr:RING-finger domain containing protein [Purpureocillium lavendulum]